MNIITIKDLCFQYEAAAQEDALRNVNLQIHQGECLVLTGESGCGKTTLIRCLNGLIPGFYEGKVTGEIFLRDTSFETLEQHEIIPQTKWRSVARTCPSPRKGSTRMLKKPFRI